jgi:predicted aldo/keto reductase-like oxidoreductase
VKAQTAQIEDQQARQLLDDALDDVLNLVSVGVGAMEQTTAKALRQAVKDGKADREELLALGKQVLEEVKAAVAPETQEIITKHLGNFEDYVMKCIEDAVLKVKQADPMALAEGIVVDTVQTE